MVQQVTTITEYDNLVNSNPLVLVDFFADWCGPCRAVAPVLEGMEQEYDTEEKKVRFVKVNVDQMTELSVKLRIAAMPTFLIYQNGVLKKTIVGANVPQIHAMLTELTTTGAPADQAVAE